MKKTWLLSFKNIVFLAAVLTVAGFPPALSGSRAQTGTDYPSLLRMFNGSQYDQVISGCLKNIDSDPSRPNIYILLARATFEKSLQTRFIAAWGTTVQALKERIKGNPWNPFLHFGLGICYKFQSRYDEAVPELEKAIFLGAEFFEAYDQLIRFYRTRDELLYLAGRLEKEIKRNPNFPYFYQGMGIINFRLSKFQEAKEYWQKAYKLHIKQQYPTEQVRSLLYTGHLSSYINDYSTAMSFLRKAYDFARNLKDQALIGQALCEMAFVYYNQGDLYKAIDNAELAINIGREIGNEDLEHDGLKTMGFINADLGNLAEAKNQLEKCRKYFEFSGDKRAQGVSCYWLAYVHHLKGDYSSALQEAKTALILEDSIGFKTGTAFNNSLLGDIYFSLGNDTKALEYQYKALEISERKITKWNESNCLNTLGHIYIKNGDYQKALGYFQQALDFVTNISLHREEPKCLFNLGYAYLKIGSMAAASKYFRASLEKSARIGNRLITAFTYNSLGEVSCRQGDFRSADEYFRKALEKGKAMGHPQIIWEAYSGLGSVAFKEKQYDKALDHYAKAIDVIEDLRNQLRFKEYSNAFFRNKINIYEDMIDLLCCLHELHPAEGYDRKCLFFVEKAKARSFLDDLHEAEVTFYQLGFSKKQQEELNLLSAKISRILTNLYSIEMDAQKRTELYSEMEFAESRIQSIHQDIKDRYLKNRGMVCPELTDLKQIQERVLDNKTAMVEFFMGERTIYGFLITRDDFYLHRISNENSRKMPELLNNYIKLISVKSDSRFDGMVASGKLYDILIAPFASHISSNVENLIIVPDGDLLYLPFETLMAGNPATNKENSARYLVQDFDFSYIPSASALVYLANRKITEERSMDILAVGDPIYQTADLNHSGSNYNEEDVVRDYYFSERFHLDPLRYASEEVHAITGLIRKGHRRILLKDEAKEENLKAQSLEDYKILHFATHSFLDERIASRSALVLTLDRDPAEDGFFQVREIYGIPFNADMIVLSACQTARGKKEKGEGIQGLSRAFMCAGAKSVVASLWNINDKSTSQFMKYFYRHLVDGKTKREALKLTKLKMLEEGYEHPYYWAAFVLIGEAGSSVSLTKRTFWNRLLDLI